MTLLISEKWQKSLSLCLSYNAWFMFNPIKTTITKIKPKKLLIVNKGVEGRVD